MTAMFWVIAGILMALVVLLLSRPLLRRRIVTAGASNRATNASIYREQLAELVRDRERGILPESDYRAAHAELERRLIEDTRSDQRESPRGDAAAQSATGGGQRSIRTAVTLLLLIPLAAIPLYFQLGKPAALDVSAAQPLAADDSAKSLEHLNQLVAKLTEKLARNPDSPQDWVMLGRVYRALGRYGDAEQAYQRAGPAANAESALILERVEMALDQNGGRIEGATLELLNGVLKKEPANPRAKFLAGYSAFSRADYKAAISYWEPLLKLVAPGSQDADNLSASIAEARARLGGDAPEILPAEASAASPSATSAAANAAVIRGKVSLAPALKARAAPSDPVFIFARAIQGPPMPLAAIRVTVADLPLEFTLDDSLAMSPQTKLSLFKTVRVEARVAKSGDVAANPGDLAGSVESVKVGTTGLALTIDHVLP
ncbi:Cytochrome c heme lyase subunit CcmH [Georgfuchsia toluolica]|uniref:Cytochrome c heme lyase subunit CcmH n=1 Tax=Georgfuchsia toluolica TaxID=424218 RepID=A0A916J0G8_9PROT|nr:c-type cytochrome biogenesis protein CcmI [Georgfuchsia toluolica]CAG4882420.1 Cytochrome c heme lyase subunit CcmH [Georgfuchsia toluolica]